MADKNDGFVFFQSYFEAMQYLPAEDRLALYDAICQFGLYGVEPEGLPPQAQGQFVLLRPNILASLKRYKANRENGAKGGAPKGNQNARKNNRKTTENQPKNNLNKDKDRDKDKETDRDKEKDAPSPRSAYGLYKNVYLTVEEHAALERDVPDLYRIVDKLSLHMQSTGRQYASHEATVRKWAMEDAEKQATARPVGDWCTQTNRTPYSAAYQNIDPALLED